MSYHSHNLGGGKSIYWSILEARGTIHVQFSGLPVASCLAVSKRDGKQLCSTLDESPKWGASPPILMRSPRMESLKQLDSSFFLDVCTSKENVRCHAFHNETHYS